MAKTAVFNDQFHIYTRSVIQRLKYLPRFGRDACTMCWFGSGLWASDRSFIGSGRLWGSGSFHCCCTFT